MSVKKQQRSRAAKHAPARKTSEPAPALPKRAPKNRHAAPPTSVRETSSVKTPVRRGHAPKSAVPSRASTRPEPKAAPDRSVPGKKPAAKLPPARPGGKHTPAAKSSGGKPAATKSPVAGGDKRPVAKMPSAAQAARAVQPNKPPVAPVTKSEKVKRPKGPPTLEELKAMQTEEVWSLYRRARKAANDPAWTETLRNALMERHYPLVRHIAERLLQTLPKSIELDDLISAGVFGLMDAIRGFEPERGIKFKTYCTTRIRGSILDQLRAQDWVPRLVRLKAARIDKAFQRLRAEYGREPTHAELANDLKMDYGELMAEIDESKAKQVVSINDRWNEHDDDSAMEKIDIVEDKGSIDPLKELNKRDMLKYITRSLTHKEQFIIEQYYQIGHTMREIGEMLALTESRVCQIHSNVMSRLKVLLDQKAEGTSE